MHLYLALHKAPRVHFRQEVSPTPTCTGKQSRAAPRHSQSCTGPAEWSATFRAHQQYPHAGVLHLCPSVAAVKEPNVFLQHPSHALRLVPSRARGRRRSSLRDMHQWTARRCVGSPHASRVPAPPCPCSETSAIQSAGAVQVQATRRVSMYRQAVSQVTLCLVERGCRSPGVRTTRYAQNRQILSFRIAAGTMRGFRAVRLSPRLLGHTP